MPKPRLRDRRNPSRDDASRRRLSRDGNPDQDRASGKAHGIIPVDSIDGPTVKLANGDVRRIDDPEEARDQKRCRENLGYRGVSGQLRRVRREQPPALAGVVRLRVVDPGSRRRRCRRPGPEGRSTDRPRVPRPGGSARVGPRVRRAVASPVHLSLARPLSRRVLCPLGCGFRRLGRGRPRRGTLVLEYAEATLEALETIIVEHRQRPDEGGSNSTSGGRSSGPSAASPAERSPTAPRSITTAANANPVSNSSARGPSMASPSAPEPGVTRPTGTTPSRRSTRSHPSRFANGRRRESETGWGGRRNRSAAT